MGDFTKGYAFKRTPQLKLGVYACKEKGVDLRNPPPNTPNQLPKSAISIHYLQELSIPINIALFLGIFRDIRNHTCDRQGEDESSTAMTYEK
jgi:hypothetical protein